MADYSEQQLLAALRKADAAGDEPAARAIAQRLHSMRQPQGRRAADMTPEELNANNARLTGTPENLDPTQGMSFGQKAWAGAGASLNQTARGLGQLVGAVDQATVDEAALAEAPLMQTGAGLTGNILGHIGQVVIPAGTAIKAGSAAPRVANAGRAVLAPTTIAGGATVGAAQSGIQPVATGESRALNTALGAGFGAGGVAIPRIAGAGIRKLTPNFSRGMQETQAARTLEEFAHDPRAVQAAIANQPNAGMIVPGSQPTLAEMTGDVGLSGLQRTMQSVSPEFNNQIAVRGLQNNASRLDYLRSMFGGADEAAAQAAESARNQAATPLLKAAQTRVGVATDRVVKLADSLIKKRDKRPAVQASVQRIRDLLVDGDQPVTDVARLINVRQSIGDMLGGSAGGEADAARAATRELLTIRDALDAQIRKASPEYAQWLRTFREGSREADRIRIGANLTERGSPIANSLGDPQLSPDKFARAAQDMDAVARKVTGFPKARADNILTPRQKLAVTEVRRDLERYANVQREGRAIGSNTVQNVVGAGRIQDMTGPVAAGALTGEPTSALAVAGLNSLRKKYGQETMRIVEEALADPVRAAEVLARLPQAQRREVVKEIAPLLLRQGTNAAAAASAAGAVPMDIGTVSGYDRNDPRYRGD